jgi:hypothetical protein
LVFYLSLFIDYRRHLINELTVREHELVYQNEISTFDGDPLSLIAAFSALSWMTASVSISTATSV